MADKRRDGPRIRGGSTRRIRSGELRGIARLLGVEGGGRRALTAAVVGLAGVAAFVASLSLDWLRITVPAMRNLGIQGGEYALGLDAADYSDIYPIGVLGLLTMLGLALPRPELARRLRLGAVALGLGLAGVLVAIGNELRDVVSENYQYPVFYWGELSSLEEVVNAQTYAPLPGQMLAFGTVALLVAAVWFAGGPARTGLGDAAATASPGVVIDAPAAAPVSPADAPQAGGATSAGPVGEPLDHPSPTAGPARVGYVDDLTVVTSDVIDLGGQADVLRN